MSLPLRQLRNSWTYYLLVDHDHLLQLECNLNGFHYTLAKVERNSLIYADAVKIRRGERTSSSIASCGWIIIHCLRR